LDRVPYPWTHHLTKIAKQHIAITQFYYEADDRSFAAPSPVTLAGLETVGAVKRCDTAPDR
jgi:hypothetical protein